MSRIKGVNIKIGGDTQGLDKALKGVNDKSRDLQSELRDVQKLLKFDPKNTELLVQKQKLLNDQIENSGKKLKTLKDVESEVQKQFERGDIKEEQYRAFQRELQDTESYLRNTKNSLKDLQNEQLETQKSTKELERLFEITGGTIEDFSDIVGTKTVRAVQQGTASSKDLKTAFDKIATAALDVKVDVSKVRTELEKLDTGKNSVKKVRKEIQKLSQDSKSAREEVKKLGEGVGELGGVIGGIGAGMGIGAIVEKTKEISDLDTSLEISMDVPEESKKTIKDSIKTVGGYIEDNETALIGVRKQFQLNADLTDKENEKIVKGASVISRAYGDIDFSELIQESFEMSESMKMTQYDALGFAKNLLDAGFPPEQLDIMAEYGDQLARAGYEAGEIQGIMKAAAETGTPNIDNLLDGLQEGRILLSEFAVGIPDAVADALEGTNITSEKLKNWGTAIVEGGEKGKIAYAEVAEALSQVEDEGKKNELGVLFYGTMWETQGERITDTINNSKGLIADLSEGQRNLNEDVSNMEENPFLQMKNSLNDLWTTLQPVFEKVAEFVTKVSEWVQKNPELAATLVAVVSGIGILLGILMALAPVFTTMITLASLLGIGIGAIASPVLIVIGVIAALIAVGVLLYQNWDSIMEWGKKLLKSISDSFSKMAAAGKKFMGNLLEDIKRIWGNVMDFFTGIDLKQIGKDIINGLIKGITSMADKVAETAKNIANGIGDKIKGILKLGSPSRLLMEMGEDTGKGLKIGLENSVREVSNASKKLANATIPNQKNAFSFETDNMSSGMNPGMSSRNMTVNINSPKTLDVREANAVWRQTMKKMSLQW
jgi:phage-related minor tail protein